jgi:hypothetical protein
MMNKKGLSDIVATVLIVLLALAAVAIVWGFLRPMFDTAAQETDLRSQCFSVDVQPTLCTYNSTTVLVRARNMAGEADSISMVVDGLTGATLNSSTQSAGDLLGTVSSSFIGSFGGTVNATSLTVAGIVSDGTNEEACPGTTIACVWSP